MQPAPRPTPPPPQDTCTLGPFLVTAGAWVLFSCSLAAEGADGEPACAFWSDGQWRRLRDTQPQAWPDAPREDGIWLNLAELAGMQLWRVKVLREDGEREPVILACANAAAAMEAASKARPGCLPYAITLLA